MKSFDGNHDNILNFNFHVLFVDDDLAQVPMWKSYCELFSVDLPTDLMTFVVQRVIVFACYLFDLLPFGGLGMPFLVSVC